MRGSHAQLCTCQARTCNCTKTISLFFIHKEANTALVFKKISLDLKLKEKGIVKAFKLVTTITNKFKQI